MGLELMGWLFFLPISSFFAAIFLFLVSNLKVKILGMGFVVAITHLLFQTDEKTSNEYYVICGKNKVVIFQ